VNQSFSWWCFENRGVDSESLLRRAAEIGYVGVDLIGEPLWEKANSFGLRVTAINGHATIDQGLNRRENASRIENEITSHIRLAEKWKIPNLICFSGRREGISDEVGLAICAETLARVTPLAESAGVTLIMELLNSKVDHADYQCDHTAWGVQLCQSVNSPAFRLLYDIYHMQIMEGDIIRTVQQHHPWIAHYHTAGNPGRGQPDETQELYYPAIYRAITATGYTGYVSHEFIPPGDPCEGLKLAFDAAL
jgi:hydroxypyruvate isomerase